MKYWLAIFFIPALAWAQPMACFTPGQDCTSVIVDHIAKAQRDILVQAYSFTSAPILDAIKAAQGRGVRVLVVLDKSQTEPAAELAQAGIAVKMDRQHAIAHNKVMIFDQAQVLTGSFNFSAAAQKRNAENLVILDDPGLVASYLDNFLRHAGHAE